MKRISALFLAAALLLCACAKELQLTFEDDGTLSDGLGNTYNSAPVGYEPTNQGAEYGKIDDAIGETLYQVGTLDPEDYSPELIPGAQPCFSIMQTSPCLPFGKWNPICATCASKKPM